WIILIGMVNFLAYTISYTIVGGESVRGKCYENREKKDDEGNYKRTYYLDSGKKVHRDQFIYIGIHSISIWVTVAAIMLAMLTLAKDHIADSMRAAAVRGRTFCTVLAVLIGICTAGLTFQFVREFIDHFENPIIGSPPAITQPQAPPKGSPNE
ncbi:MAG: hypothetical protein K8S55_01315, partial [Phycisphaerae bacterium]|nr:hypothetical protein [Phycisphaerae bacterium]